MIFFYLGFQFNFNLQLFITEIDEFFLATNQREKYHFLSLCFFPEDP